MKLCKPKKILYLLSLLAESAIERGDYNPDIHDFAKLSINLFIYESDPNDEKIEDVLFMQIEILNSYVTEDITPICKMSLILLP